MIKLHTLGFPKSDERYELSLLQQKCGQGDSLDAPAWEALRQVRARRWQQQRAAGLDYVTVGDFALCDHVTRQMHLLGCEPGVAATAEKARWFDTNCSYAVPEFSRDMAFSPSLRQLIAEVDEAQDLGHSVKVVLIGPLTLLWLGKSADSEFERLDVLERLLDAYGEILSALKAHGVEWVQIDEPILGRQLPREWMRQFEPAYIQLGRAGVRILLATYFSPLQENLTAICKLPVDGLHIDAVGAPKEVDSVADWLPRGKVLSIGIVDGNSVWRTDLDAALEILRAAVEKRGKDVWLAPSCSLQHVPMSLRQQTELDPPLKDWLAFAQEKLAELAVLRTALADAPMAAARLADNRRILKTRDCSHDAKIRACVDALQVTADLPG